MDKRLKFAGGEIELSSDEINLMPESNHGAIEGINKGLTATGQDMIASGVFAVITAGSDAIIQEGFVVLNGETLKVDAQEVAETEGSDLYEFQKVTTYPSTGERNFRDNTTHLVYEKNRAIAVNVASITTLSIVGDTLIDILKELIRIQSDWNQTNVNEPDYIKNKPTSVSSVMIGECHFGDIGSGSGAISFSGDLLTATKISGGNYSTVTVTFPDVGTSNYTISANFINLGGNTDMKGWIIEQQTSTTISITTSEESGNTQDLTLRIQVLK